MKWEHLVTIAHGETTGRRIPAVRVTREQGSQLPELRCSYTFCFYDEVDNTLRTVLHVPGKYVEAFASVLVNAVTMLRYGGTTDPDMLAMRALSHGARAVDPTAKVLIHAEQHPQKTKIGTNMGEALRRSQ